MNAEEINKILGEIFKKDTTTDKEKDALLEACDCVWKANASKVVDEKSFSKLLYDNMAYDYDIKVEETNKDTRFIVSTFKKGNA